MEHQAGGVAARRLPGRRLVLAAATAVALGAAVVTGVSANGGPGGPGGGRGGITITAINGSSLSLATDDGWTRTIDASGVTLKNGDTAITLGDLKVGEKIDLRQSRNFDGSVAVTEIDVVQPDVDGMVTAIDASSLTVRTADGSTTTVTLTGTTTYTVNRGPATRDGITVGSEVHVQGTAAADGTITATSVAAHPASIGGTVTATTADSITIKDASGATATIKVTASTVYRTASGAGTLADVTSGSVIRAEGTRTADGTLTATGVGIGTADGGFRGPDGLGDPRGGHGHGRGPGGGPGGFGFGGPGGPGGSGNQGNPGNPGTPAAPAAPSASPSA
jgi:hypothetical protein